jgi:hypothetical protein
MILSASVLGEIFKDGGHADLDNPTTPCFVATYAGISPLPISPACDDTLTMAPLAGYDESLYSTRLVHFRAEFEDVPLTWQ